MLAAVTTLIYMVLAPSEPQWRFVLLSDRAARRIVWLLYGITAVYAVDVALTEISRVFFVPLPVSVVQSFIASMTFAVLLIGLLLTPFEPRPRHSPRWLKAPLWAIAFAILVAALLGYVALARFIAQQLVMTGLVVVIVCLGYLAIRRSGIYFAMITLALAQMVYFFCLEALWPGRTAPPPARSPHRACLDAGPHHLRHTFADGAMGLPER